MEEVEKVAAGPTFSIFNIKARVAKHYETTPHKLAHFSFLFFLIFVHFKDFVFCAIPERSKASLKWWYKRDNT